MKASVKEMLRRLPAWSPAPWRSDRAEMRLLRPEMGQIMADADFLGRFVAMGLLDAEYVEVVLRFRTNRIYPEQPHPYQPGLVLEAGFGACIMVGWVLGDSIRRWERIADRREEAVRKAIAPYLMTGAGRADILRAADIAAHAEPFCLTVAAVEAIVLEEVAWWLRQGRRAKRPAAGANVA